MRSGDEEPVPGLDIGPDSHTRPLLYTLEVDGEVFEVRRGQSGGTNYDWVSGPNKDYGFGSSGGSDMPEEWHLESIRNFLSMIDPATGYIEED
jgi:hypothetical protein